MPTYHFELSSATGQPLQGNANAASLPALVAQFREQGWRVERLLQDPGAPPFRYWRRVSTNELSTFLRQLAVMLRNQVPVPEAVGLIARECRNPVLQTVLHQVEAAVRSGEPLSAALARYPRLFGPMQTATLEAGESSNTLDQVAERLADYGEMVNQSVRSIRLSSFYPTIVCAVAASLLCFTFLCIVPKFLQLYRDLGVKELPFYTQWLMIASQWAGPVLLLLGLQPVALAAISYGLQRGRSFWMLDRMRLRAPLLSPMFQSLSLFRLSGMLSIFLESNMPLLDALRLAGQGAGNEVVQGAVWEAIPRVAAGERLGRALEASGVLPPAYCGQLAVAEEKADLPGTLRRLAKWHSEYVEGTSKKLGAILEPALIVVIGGCVAWIVLGLFIPFIQIIQNLSGPTS